MDGEVSNVPGAHVWIGCFANTNDASKGTMSSQVFVERRTAGYDGPLAVGPGPWERLLIEIWPQNKEGLAVWPPPLAFANDNQLGMLFDRFFTGGARPSPR
jgi:hypothetical protein